ncbi:MAG: DUF971 domain-containing protein [Phycisphaerales bacterium]|nr:DUF971 domain-containing protein [Phycisphaerales bacterium]
MTIRPLHLDLDRENALTVQWNDGRTSRYPILYLRRMSPSADARALREQLAANPLTVLPSSSSAAGTALAAVDAELVGNYALRIRFTDGHSTGIYSWTYLREIDPDHPEPPADDA